MLTFKFLYEKKGEYYYEYYAEGKHDDAGIVAMNNNGEGRIVNLSPSDEFKRYAFHAIYGIDVPNEKSGTVAWY